MTLSKTSACTGLLICLFWLTSACTAHYLTPPAGVSMTEVAGDGLGAYYDAQPASGFPANLAIVRVRQGGYSTKTNRGYGYGRYSVVARISAKQKGMRYGNRRWCSDRRSHGLRLRNDGGYGSRRAACYRLVDGTRCRFREDCGRRSGVRRWLSGFLDGSPQHVRGDHAATASNSLRQDSYYYVDFEQD